jgi:hypothetical protein
MLTIATRCRLSLHNRDGPGIPNFTLFVHVVVGCNLSLCINIVRGESENVPWTRTTIMSFAQTVARVLLTYSAVMEADASDADILWMLESFMDCAQHATHYRLALERHAEGHYHVHLYLHYTPPFRITNPAYFDIGDCHPNIEAVRLTEVDHLRVLSYLAKDGMYWGDMAPCHHLTPDAVYQEAMVAGNRKEAFDLIRTHRPRDVFMGHVNVMKGLDHFYPRPGPPPYIPLFTEFRSLPRALQDFVLYMELDGRKMGLVLFGPSRMGKTAWARSLGHHNYFKGRFDINTFDDSALYHVFDDIDKFSLFKYKLWFGADDFIIDGKYKKDAKITGGKPCIFICNDLPRVRDHGSVSNHEWWLRNTVRVFVDRPLY